MKGRKSRGDDSDIKMQRAKLQVSIQIRLTTRHHNLPLTSILFAVDGSHWHTCSTGEFRLSRGPGCWSSGTQRSPPKDFGVKKTLTLDGDWIASLTAPANGTCGPLRPRLPKFRCEFLEILVHSRSGGALKAATIRRLAPPGTTSEFWASDPLHKCPFLTLSRVFSPLAPCCSPLSIHCSVAY